MQYFKILILINKYLNKFYFSYLIIFIKCRYYESMSKIIFIHENE